MDLSRWRIFEYGAKFLARGGASEVLEGQEFERHVVIEFPDMETARECYFSPEYQLDKSKRQGCCDVMVSFVEGI